MQHLKVENELWKKSTTILQIKEAYDDSKQRYWAVKICHSLNNSGTACILKRVQRHMATQGLRSIVVKKYNIMPIKGLLRMTRKTSWNMILLLKASTRNSVQTWHTSISRKKDGRISPLSWTYAAAKLLVIRRTGGVGSKKRLSERKGYRRNHPSQRFWEPVYQSDVWGIFNTSFF